LQVSYGGITRELRCRPYSITNVRERETTATVILSFLACDPYWYAPTIVSAVYTSAIQATFFPFFPLKLSSSAVFNKITVSNPGVETWPIWTITGPGENLNLHNITTDDQLALTTSLAAGDKLIIDTRSLIKTVLKNGSINCFGDISDSSRLWPLADGDNDIWLELSNTNANSRVQLDYTPRYGMK
jgi:hypothetical protein